jgi:hypothetical protein
MKYETLPLPGGPFQHVESCRTADGRLLFVMRSLHASDFIYLVHTAEESNGTVTALVVGTGFGRFDAIRRGEIPLREAFNDPGEFSVFQIEWGFIGSVSPSVDVRAIPVSWIPERWLPVDSVLLGSGRSLIFA